MQKERKLIIKKQEKCFDADAIKYPIEGLIGIYHHLGQMLI